MEKTIRHTPIFAEDASEKVDKGGLCLEDHINGLPDVVLVSILSLLTMKEAARTSVLSKKWRYLWTHITVLHFDAPHLIDGILLEDKELKVERLLYLSWVNQVLKSNNSPSVDEFRVHFDLDESCSLDIDNWVNFAIEKRVKRLELELSEIWRTSEGYSFPDTGYITSHLHSLSLGFTCWNSLTDLRLAHVNITGQVLEYFLSNCTFLEQLSVQNSDLLVNLKVPNTSLKLKRLEIIYCFDVENIEIFAMNLMSFKYFGPKINQPFKNVPWPVEMYIGGEYSKELLYNFLEFSSYLSQLESLTLDVTMMHLISIHDFFIIDEFPKFPVFHKLKQLKLKIDDSYDESLVIFTPLIEACPFLCKFVLELTWIGSNVHRKWQGVKFWPHQYLKEVEFIGFVGQMIDTELAMYLIKGAVKLEKITFDSRNPSLIGTPWEFMETKRRKKARKRAEKFRTKLPAKVALVIL
ncbi:F-box/FBD/LRR-repeat protein At1g16930-like [Cornus florida]|uniref:F-box/FBD/LRR-repeat protein At1g16930-like n=1 Tax=Cornus florida TaxID=4283 RepID=UPI00289D505C|nr:F-box/FBD/LRR-repeat protein At1g16930-like [Cornus florida]XP_059658904.1 F-box/FBD/LRR-repeat protein At1g16930-like [Cornus florida]